MAIRPSGQEVLIMTTVTLSNVSLKSKNSRKNSHKTIIDQLNLNIKSGEFLCVFGASGCGKSSLLKIIAGLFKPDAGEVFFDNNEVTHSSTSERNLGMVFQDFALYPHMNVYENIAFPLKIKKVSPSQIAKDVSRLSEQLQIAEKLDHFPNQLSHGEQQRVAIARALIKKPAVFLLDEPLSNLDQKLKQQLLVDLKLHHRKFGCTSLYVTHDTGEAMALADTVVILKNGKIIQQAPPIEIYEFPCNQFVAESFGFQKINLIPATFIEQQGDIALIDLFGYRQSVKVDASRLEKGAQVKLGFRAESVFLGSDDDLLVQVKQLQYLGHTTYVQAKLDNSNTLLEFLLPGTIKLKEGEAINFMLPPERLHLFDVSGESLPRNVSLDDLTTPPEFLI